MEIFIGILIVIVLCLAVSFIVANKMYKQLIFSPGQAGGFLFEREAIQGRYLLSDFNHWRKDTFYIYSQFGYHLCGTHIHATQLSNKFVILCHGFSCQQLTAYKYVQLFLDEGFHVIVYDHRFHGLSGGDFITYGYYEKDDLSTLVRWVRQRFGSDAVVGVHGESMGASIGLLYASRSDNEADFYIADCPFSDFRTIIGARYKHSYPKVPHFPFFQLSQYIWKKKLGFSWYDISPVYFMKNIKKPVLLIHTKRDRFTVCQHSIDLHKADPGGTELVLLPEGGHAQAIVKNHEAYVKTVHTFLKKIS